MKSSSIKSCECWSDNYHPADSAWNVMVDIKHLVEMYKCTLGYIPTQILTTLVYDH